MSIQMNVMFINKNKILFKNFDVSRHFKDVSVVALLLMRLAGSIFLNCLFFDFVLCSNSFFFIVHCYVQNNKLYIIHKKL